MLFTINEGDVVQSVDNPSKVGIVQGWTSSGSHTLVSVKFAAANLQENFSSRSLDLVKPYKPKASRGTLAAVILGFLVTAFLTFFAVDFAVEQFNWSEKTDWIVSGIAFVTVWGVFEGRYKNRGRTKIKHNRQTAIKITKP